ncbi:MAG: alpha/beta hydrolase-fold protein [Actinomycetota bacterium]|nr:alpha/beta hydrolase-fold protein [Actinomycetota bacterium]
MRCVPRRARLPAALALVVVLAVTAVVLSRSPSVLPGASTLLGRPRASDPRAHCSPGAAAGALTQPTGLSFQAGLARPATETGPGRVETIQVPAPDAPGGQHEVWIYRPDVPDSATLPVVYFLHGVPGGDRDIEQSMIVPFLEQSFAEGQRPFVVVAPDGNSTGAEDSEWGDSPAGGVRVESFVTGALIEAVEGSARRDAPHRAIMGFSMGGYGAMNLAMRHRDLYGSVASLAGYFHVDDPSAVFGTDRAALDANSPKQHPAQALGLHVLLADGTEDEEPAVRGEAACFGPLLRAAGVAVQVDLTPGTHSFDWLDSELPALLRFLEGGWPAG